MNSSHRPEAFAAWYAQVPNAATLPIQDLMEAFDQGVTPEEMSAR